MNEKNVLCNKQELAPVGTKIEIDMKVELSYSFAHGGKTTDVFFGHGRKTRLM